MSFITQRIPQEAITAFSQVYQKNALFWMMSGCCLGGATLYYSYIRFNGINEKHLTKFRALRSSSNRSGKRVKSAVNGTFIRKLRRLLKIAIPGWNSKEVFYLFVLGVFLVLRTLLSIRIAHINGTIVRSIVKQNFWMFISRILTLGSIAVPASFVNSSLAFFTAKLALQFRSRLVSHFHDAYLEPMMYYKVSNLDSRIVNPDQALTETLTLWGKSLSELYTNVTKPILDIVLFSRQLAALMGWEGPGAVFAYYALSLVTIRVISPPFGILAAISQNLEGNFRTSHHRLITHSEEIAFYTGHNREKEHLNEQFDVLREHSEYCLSQKWGMGAFNGFLQKYGSVMCGYAVLGLPVFGTKREEYLARVNSASDITQDYIRNSSLLINLSKAIGRIVTSYEDVQRLAGYTGLVSDLEDVIADLRDGVYVRRMVDEEKLLAKNMRPGGGVVTENCENIRFHDVSVVTPNGDILVERIDFEIRRGMNLMIVGPNGCGKSSLFRILGGLWPVFDGHLYKPKSSDVFYIPQKPYLAVGTLRDQVIYPDTKEQFLAKGWTDEQLTTLLAEVQLNYIVDRHEGWDAMEEWFDVLSGGEKQRMAMARVFYHKPRFAILDECTSAVSVDVEGYMYTHCKTLGIALITISHRPSLWKYHDFKLEMDGRGAWSFGEMELPENYTGIP